MNGFFFKNATRHTFQTFTRSSKCKGGSKSYSTNTLKSQAAYLKLPK